MKVESNFLASFPKELLKSPHLLINFGDFFRVTLNIFTYKQTDLFKSSSTFKLLKFIYCFGNFIQSLIQEKACLKVDLPDSSGNDLYRKCCSKGLFWRNWLPQLCSIYDCNSPSTCFNEDPYTTCYNPESI